MSRHRFCPTNDRDGFIETLAEEIWEEREGGGGGVSWLTVSPERQLHFRRLATDTLRYLEHGHG